MKVFDELFDLVFPPLCVCCDSVLQSGEHLLCTVCRFNLPATFNWERVDNYLEDIFAGRLFFVQASALMFFRRGGIYQRLIHRLKYGYRRDVAYLLGEIYGHLLLEQGRTGAIDCVIAVPLHWRRFVGRGYNQSERFAAGIASSMGVELVDDVLYRKYSTYTQARMGSVEQRAQNVAGAFRTKNVDKIAGKNILLVDDVITSGATIEACGLAIAVTSPTTIINIGAMAIVQSSKYIRADVDDDEMAELKLREDIIDSSYADKDDLVGVEPIHSTSHIDGKRD